jgi:hypothetical protein
MAVLAAICLQPIVSADEPGKSRGTDPHRQGGAQAYRKHIVARRSADSFDAGDAYSTPGGQKRLYRLAGAVAVKRVSNDAWTNLTAPGGVLSEHELFTELGQGIRVFKSTRPAIEDPTEEVEVRQALLARLRSDARIRFAQPVFVSRETGLLLVPTGDIILRLKPGVVPVSFFGADWAKVRPLGGTTDQFILAVSGLTAEQILVEVDRLARDYAVMWAQPDLAHQKKQQLTPNDTSFPLQWSLNNTGQGGGRTNVDINAPEAWNITFGSSNIVIAILDDSLQLNHPDLAANIFTNPGEIANNGVDDDGNGYVDDLHGWDFDNNDNNPNPDLSDDDHGTACAGVAAAVGNNNAGVAGVAYGCRILPVKFALASDSATAESFYYAAGRAKDGVHSWQGQM